MLNSKMPSRKNEIMIELKDNLIKHIYEEEMFSKLCEDNIEKIDKRKVSWLTAYICIAVMLVSGLSALAFISYGYSENTWIILRNALCFVFAGIFAYGIYFYSYLKKNKTIVEQWIELQIKTKENISTTREYLKKINKELYENV